MLVELLFCSKAQVSRMENTMGDHKAEDVNWGKEPQLYGKIKIMIY